MAADRVAARRAVVVELEADLVVVAARDGRQFGEGALRPVRPLTPHRTVAAAAVVDHPRRRVAHPAFQSGTKWPVVTEKSRKMTTV